MIQINDLLKKMEESGYDEIHLSAGTEPFFRKADKITPAMNEKPSRSDLEAILKSCVSQTNYNDFMQKNELSASYSVSGQGRYLIYAFSQRNSIALVLKKAYHSINECNIELKGVRNLKITPGIALLTGKHKKKEAGMCLLMYLLKNKSIIMTAEDRILYPLPHSEGYIFQCEKEQDYTDIHSFLNFIKKINPNVLYIESSLDCNIYNQLMQLAASGIFVIINMPFNDIKRAVDNIRETLISSNNVSAEQYIHLYVTEKEDGGNVIYSIENV